MPLGSSRGNSRLSTPSTSTSVSASASASGSSPSLTAFASALAAAAASAPSSSNDGAAAAASPASVTTLPASTTVTNLPAKAIQFTACPSTKTTTTTTITAAATTTIKLPTITAAAAATTTASSSSSSSPSRPSFLSRLSRPLHLPLRSRPRSITDFHILCDEPHKKYIAGDAVRGAVVILVVKPLRLTHLVVTLHGFVRVLKDAAAVAKVQTTTTLPPGGSSSRPQYHGNGFASLFQDEQVLCGEGRLEPGRYEFQFDLVFPDKGLPSSIDFERGTISYMITATLTKPTSIAPTVSCERKIMLAERINVGLLAPPRPRAIFLEPISKRTRRKKSSMTLERGVAPPAPPPPLQPAAAAETTDLTSEAGSLELSVTASESAHDFQPLDQRTAQSDVQSEVSGESSRSAGAALTAGDLSLQFKAAHQQAVDNKTITATIELLKGGCLPGDTVSVRVTVQHVKRVKSMTGVVVTLFRQGKIDYAPSSSLFSGTMSKEDARRLQMDEMYPRSRTGLSGLSLSSAGSVSMFRKDLDQTTAPLIIDPVTLQASITVPVKVPDDSFPTIRGVPGDMISFKYQVEVIVDLGGKLSGQLQGGQTAKLGPFNTGSENMTMNMFSSRREASILETSQLKRQKGVISVSMESVVGTVDSSIGRKHGKSKQRMDGASEDDGYDTDAGNPDENDSLPMPDHQRPQPYYSSPPLSPPRPYPSQPSANHYTRGPAPSYVPPPQLPDPRSMSEKDRIRQAEARLLPSQPPAAGPAPDDDDIYDAHDHPRIGHGGDEPSAPTEEELEASLLPAGPEEDKQERERRRLMEEASAPEFPEDGALYDAVTDVEPTAPVLDGVDEEDYAYRGSSGRSGRSSGRGEGGGDGEQLPAYQR